MLCAQGDLSAAELMEPLLSMLHFYGDVPLLVPRSPGDSRLVVISCSFSDCLSKKHLELQLWCSGMKPVKVQLYLKGNNLFLIAQFLTVNTDTV